jgi:hypothetical protein
MSTTLEYAIAHAEIKALLSDAITSASDEAIVQLNAGNFALGVFPVTKSACIGPDEIIWLVCQGGYGNPDDPGMCVDFARNHELDDLANRHCDFDLEPSTPTLETQMRNLHWVADQACKSRRLLLSDLDRAILFVTEFWRETLEKRTQEN